MNIGLFPCACAIRDRPVGRKPANSSPGDLVVTDVERHSKNSSGMRGRAAGGITIVAGVALMSVVFAAPAFAQTWHSPSAQNQRLSWLPLSERAIYHQVGQHADGMPIAPVAPASCRPAMKPLSAAMLRS